MTEISQYYHIPNTGEYWPVYLRVYRLPRMMNFYADQWQKAFSFHNHCSIRVANIVIHFWDMWQIPKWVRADVDWRMRFPKKEILIGYTNKTLKEIQTYTNSLKAMSYYDSFCRVLWTAFYTYWPKRNDCVHRCSKTLQWMGFKQTIYSTPDELYKLYL